MNVLAPEQASCGCRSWWGVKRTSAVQLWPAASTVELVEVLLP